MPQKWQPVTTVTQRRVCDTREGEWEMVETREERKEQFEHVVEARRPVKVEIHEIYELYYGRGRAKVGSLKRNAKGREYVSPRILLKGLFQKAYREKMRSAQRKSIH